ncbi:MAG TPA: M20/M25/M40 family metallo-hydrolase, partial [Bacteroidales bacterium]|nr:M20/M25/M40 family metallo-hydrolase [Bacteroidales bacterium]
QDITIAEKSINYLASDELEGRFPGTKGDSLSIAYISGEFQRYGINGFDEGFVQNFDVLTAISPGNETSISLNNDALEMNHDFMPLTFSAEKANKAAVHLCRISGLSGSAALNGQWLVVLPDAEEGRRSYRELIGLALDAKDAGAGGMVLLVENDSAGVRGFYPFRYSRTVGSAGIPAIQMSASAFEKALKKAGYAIDTENPDPRKVEALNAESKMILDGRVSIDQTYSTTANICGYVEGKDTSAWLVVGAHYDHLGYGGYGSGSRTPDQCAIHNGADDNASGVAMVLMLADYYAKKQPDINIAFVLFGAEEEGLIGSSYFVDNMLFQPENVKAMINYDMIGRVEDSLMSISGVKTADEFEDILNTWNEKPMKLKLGGGGYAGSDQASFYSEGVPVLFFNSGLHDDYHKPSDDVDKINFDGIKLTAGLSVKLIDSLDDPNTRLTYRKAKQSDKSRHGGGTTVTLGIMPDVAGKAENGLGVDGVRPGGPAEKAGVEKDDVIVQIGKYTISGIYEYMKVLSNFEKGDKVKLVVIKDGVKRELELTF